MRGPAKVVVKPSLTRKKSVNNLRRLRIADCGLRNGLIINALRSLKTVLRNQKVDLRLRIVDCGFRNVLIINTLRNQKPRSEIGNGFWKKTPYIYRCRHSEIRNPHSEIVATGSRIETGFSKTRTKI
jgi:hypothetical protein